MKRKQMLAESCSPPQELEEGRQSRLYYLLKKYPDLKFNFLKKNHNHFVYSSLFMWNIFNKIRPTMGVMGCSDPAADRAL